MTSRVRLAAQIGLPVAIVLVGVITFGALVKARRAPERQRRVTPPPLVQVIPATRQEARLDVASHGEVAARTETQLASQVAGQIVEMSPALASGGFFRKGEVLAWIDPRDYRVAVARAEARLAQERVRLAREEGEAKIARGDWESLGRGEEPDPLVVREPQLAEARAGLASAAAEVEKARLDLARAEITAPYEGRVRSKSVDVGQYLAPGAPIARIYAVDDAEIRLPIPSSEIAFLELPMSFRAGRDAGPAVALRAEFGGQWWQWEGRIVRTEGEIDPRTRMIHAVAHVEDPYGLRVDREGPPLAVGLFVEADIEGRVVSDVFVLPRSVLRGPDRVLIVDDEDRLQFRGVDVLRVNGEDVVIRGGLEEGERVCASPLELAVEGMPVRVARTSPESSSPVTGMTQ